MPRTSHHRRPMGGRGNRRGSAGRVSAPAWTPASLTTLRGWYRADLGITLNGGDVEAWGDQSGNGNHLTDGGSASRRPLYVASDAAFNGRPVLEFDGVGEWLNDATFSWGNTVAAHTIIAIYQNVTASAAEPIVSYGAGVRPVLRQSATGTADYVASGGVVVSTSTVITAAPKMVIATNDGTNSRIYVGASLEGGPSAVTPAIADGGSLAIGSNPTGTSPANIRVAEVILTRAAVSAGDITELVAYAARYGL